MSLILALILLHPVLVLLHVKEVGDLNTCIGGMTRIGNWGRGGGRLD